MSGRTSTLSTAQLDRACGAVLASAVGDALGAGYEFGAAPFRGWPEMIGGGLGGFRPGEWTDDTAQAMAILRVAATGLDLRSEEARDSIARGFANWFAAGPPDIGVQTSRVLRLAGPGASASTMAAAADEVRRRSPRSAGNGSLMRTAPVALAHLDDPAALVEAAVKVSALTHVQDVACEAAALWCLLIRTAVLSGEMPRADEAVAELERHLGGVSTDWRALLDEAEQKPPAAFSANGWVVGALQAAWSAVVHTPVPDGLPCRQLQDGLATAIGIGHDTDTVGAIAGALLGARWGATAIPQAWQAPLHGWGADDRRGAAALVRMATLAVQGGRTATRSRWPSCARMDYAGFGGETTYVPHPLVDGVWMGGALPLDDLPAEIDAVVSLCRIGTRQLPDHLVSHQVRLVDTVAEDNPNVAFIIDDAARTVLRLRSEGRRVYLHCVASHSRTPTVAIRVGVLAGHPLEDSRDAVLAALPTARPRRFLTEALAQLSSFDRRPVLGGEPDPVG